LTDDAAGNCSVLCLLSSTTFVFRSCAPSADAPVIIQFGVAMVAANIQQERLRLLILCPADDILGSCDASISCAGLIIVPRHANDLHV